MQTEMGVSILAYDCQLALRKILNLLQSDKCNKIEVGMDILIAMRLLEKLLIDKN